ncbi:MAG: hypothetical protein VKN33_10085 [Candidatus Sericytochromatia bacterium]|nr:hypothetical protein [Candidatus Sericytochromatia bacterium]
MGDSPYLVVLRPGRVPAQAVVWGDQAQWTMPLGAFGTSADDASDAEARAWAGLMASREVLLAVWATVVGPESGAPQVRAVEVRRLSGGLWAFELSHGGAIVVPSAWIGAEIDASLESPQPLFDGRWWVWPEASVAVEVGDLLLRQLTGEKEGVGLFCAPLPALASDVEAFNPPRGPLFGLVLARQGLLGRSALAAALQAQQRSLAAGKRIRLGEICISLGLLEPYQLNFALAFQHRVQGLDPSDQIFVDQVLQLDLASPASMFLLLDRKLDKERTFRQLAVDEGIVSSEFLAAFEADPSAGNSAFFAALRSDERPESSPHLRPDENYPIMEEAPDIGEHLGGAGLRSLLGAILMREEYLTRDQLHLVLCEQIRRRRAGSPIAFGQLARQLGFVAQEDLDFAVRLQARLEVGTTGPRPLGLFLMEYGVVKPSQLSEALDEALSEGQPLGQVLVGRGMLTPDQLRVFLEMQRRAMEFG